MLRWLNQYTLAGGTIAFWPVFNTAVLRDWHRLTPRIVDPQKESFTWYVLQNRPGTFTRINTRLMQHEKPTFVKYAGRRSWREGA